MANSDQGAAQRSSVFISYSHRDRSWLNRLLVHLKPLEEAGIDLWVDTRMTGGEDWRREIADAIATTKAAILLVSIDFLTSDFIANDELPPLLSAVDTEAVLILQVFVSPCERRFKRTPKLEKFETFNRPERPMSRLSTNDREELWDRLAARIEDFLNP